MAKKGEFFNLSFDGKRITSGWLLFITEEKEEYLIRQNSGVIGFKGFTIQRKIYTSDISLESKKVLGSKVKKRIKNNSEYKYIGVVAVLSAIIRNNVPKDWIWGETNLPINVMTGIVNLFFFWLLLALCFSVVSFYRKMVFDSHLKKLKGNLILLGKGCEYKKQGEYNVIKKRSIVIFAIFVSFLFVLTVILPFVVQERLFAFVIIVILGMLFFNGKVYSDKKVIEYRMVELNKAS
ncbi:hypothetical protein [Candidatus Enterococcus mansonii]|uniref:hypothetical protein n=1 Tax=Candidatus Enterococcus mansonii TaxID=1834181 RepID=UPI0011782393|nr:hypothetical protein [Enterococcus sp. 4G2_DIV0659]